LTVPLAGSGEARHPVAALNQPDAKVTLHLPDRRRQGWLGHVQALSRAAEAQRFSHRQELLHLS